VGGLTPHALLPTIARLLRCAIASGAVIHAIVPDCTGQEAAFLAASFKYGEIK
jgi:hypothetical protein